jgi:hypothetical protein
MAENASKPPSKWILVTCRPLRPEENAALAKNFKSIIAYNAVLHKSVTDVNKMQFDCLILNDQYATHHAFLESICAQAKASGIGRVVLKQKNCNSKPLIRDLEALVIKEIKDLDNGDLVKDWVKPRISQIENRKVYWLKKLARLLFKCAFAQ